MIVTLDPWQYKFCVGVAADRMATSNTAGWNHASTYERDYLERTREEIIGACGEMAAALALNVFWSPSVNTFHAVSDLPGNVEVRSTPKTTGRVSLIIRDNDPDDRVYVLVVGVPPTLDVVGWYIGADAKQPHYLSDPGEKRPAWFVPRAELHAVEVLAEHLAHNERMENA